MAFKIYKAISKLQITNYKLQITNYKLQTTNYKLQIVSQSYYLFFFLLL